MYFPMTEWWLQFSWIVYTIYDVCSRNLNKTLMLWVVFVSVLIRINMGSSQAHRWLHFWRHNYDQFFLQILRNLISIGFTQSYQHVLTFEVNLDLSARNKFVAPRLPPRIRWFIHTLDTAIIRLALVIIEVNISCTVILQLKGFIHRIHFLNNCLMI